GRPALRLRSQQRARASGESHGARRYALRRF
ncbi:hypothetical protein BN1708_018213, partial [Verticillium longisporum]